MNGRILRAMSGLTGPISAVLKSKDSTSTFRNDELLGRIQERLGNQFEICRFQSEEGLPLSWSLSSEAKEAIIGSLNNDELNKDAIEQMKNWLL